MDERPKTTSNAVIIWGLGRRYPIRPEQAERSSPTMSWDIHTGPRSRKMDEYKSRETESMDKITFDDYVNLKGVAGVLRCIKGCKVLGLSRFSTSDGGNNGQSILITRSHLNHYP